MISSMTKYSFLIYYKEYDEFLLGLRELGMLHVKERQSGALQEGSEVQVKMQLLARYEAAIKGCTHLLGDDFSACKEQGDVASAEGLLEQYEALEAKAAKLDHEMQVLTKEIAQMSVWGDFSWDNIEALRAAGHVMGFYTVSARNYNEAWEDDYNAIIINNDGVQVSFVTLTPESQVVAMVDVEKVQLPKVSFSEYLKQENELEVAQNQLQEEKLKFVLANYETIAAGHRATQESIDYSKVVLNSAEEVENKLLLLEGWMPTDECDKANAYFDEKGLVYFSQAMGKDDAAPIKLSNNRFARLFHPITELYEMPSYGEIDLTPLFAPFFVMFFGLCLGDAGYGLILILIGLIARKKVKDNMKDMMTLVSIFGLGTLIFGFISGTFFGIPLLDVSWPWIQKAKAVMLDSDQLFNLSLIIGCVQILFGMVIKVIGQTMRFGFKNSLSAWGWLVAIAGSGMVFGAQELEMVTPDLAQTLYYVVLGVAAIGIFILNDIKRNPLINIGAGLWDTYNMATGLMGDVLSYVRLFALGISGSVLGLVFNDLARQMSPDIPVVGFLVSALILLFGHSMNIFMSGLGAFVHPLRLTFVEFYKNAGFEGGGKKYSPFARVKKQD